MSDPAQASISQQCFAIFEGGGAKGITHLGALKALETTRLARIGAAGTSAGAIIAALTAVGFAPDELFDPSGESNILRRMNKTPVSLLGEDDWKLFGSFRRPVSAIAAVRFGQKLRKSFFVIAMTLIPPLLPLLTFRLARSTGQPLLLRCAWRILEDFGFFDTTGARDLLNAMLCEKLGLPPEHRVCFRDIEPSVRPTCCALKIITTNLTRGSIELFSQATPDVVVADAVAASFSIPVFFKPSRIRRIALDGTETVRDDLYVDGGLLSNLPVWVFFEDKRSIERAPENRDRPPIPIIAFRLEAPEAMHAPDPAGHPVRRCLGYIGDVVRTGIFGGQAISQKFVTHLTVVTLPTPLTVIQFDCTKEQALAAYRSGLTAALDQLQQTFEVRPLSRQKLLRDLLDQAKLRSAAIRAGQPLVAHFRACLLRPLGDRSFKVIASVNMEGDADDDLVLDQRNPGAPTACKDRNFTFVDLRPPPDPQTAAPDLRMTKYERALVRPQLQSVIAVPIFATDQWEAEPAARTEPVGAFCLDSDSFLELEYRDDVFLNLLATATIKFAPYMTFGGETT